MRPVTAIRLRCCVPFCNHTRGQRKGDTEPVREGQEWVCGKHWMAIPKQVRRVRYRIGRELDKAIAREPLVREYWKLPKGEQRIAALNLWRRQTRIWRRCRAIAIERAMGIG